MEPVTTLQHLVLDRLRDLGDRSGPLSTRLAARRSGGKVSYETLRKIARGEHSGDISDDVAQGIALALEVPLSQVHAAAGQRPALGRFELPRRADRLTAAERRTVIAVVDSLLNAREVTAQALSARETAAVRRARMAERPPRTRPKDGRRSRTG